MDFKMLGRITLVVKGYLNGIDEIRRFKLNFDGSDDINLLKKGISHAFSLPLESIEKLCWKDSDGDMINFTSQEEIEEAIEECSGSVFKVYISTTLNSRQTNGHKHEAVECDMCQQIPLIGRRYKCLTCHDYDLCEPCFNKHSHEPHNFIMFERPTDPQQWVPSVLRLLNSRCTLLARDGVSVGQPTDGQHNSSSDPNNSEGHMFLNQMGTFVTEWLSKMGVDASYEVNQDKKPEQQVTDKKEENSTEDKDQNTPFHQSVVNQHHNIPLTQTSVTEAENFTAMQVATPERTPEPQNQSDRGDTIAPPLLSGQGEPHQVPHRSIYPSAHDFFPAQDVPMGVKAAFEQMITMGYTNENGWLLELLKQTNGDIDQALDIVSSKTL